MKTLLFLCSLLIILFAPVQARDNGQWANSDPEIVKWYKGLMQPDAPTASCCGKADAYYCDIISVKDSKTFCTITDTRDDALLGRPHVPVGTQIEIPNTKLKWDAGNPTGHAIVFLSSMRYVYCFVQGTGT